MKILGPKEQAAAEVILFRKKNRFIFINFSIRIFLLKLGH